MTRLHFGQLTDGSDVFLSMLSKAEEFLVGWKILWVGNKFVWEPVWVMDFSSDRILRGWLVNFSPTCVPGMPTHIPPHIKFNYALNLPPHIKFTSTLCYSANVPRSVKCMESRLSEPVTEPTLTDKICGVVVP